MSLTKDGACAMRLGSAVAIGMCAIVAGTHSVGAQGRAADSGLSGFRLWMDSVDMPSHLRWNSTCPVNSDSPYAPAAHCIVSDVPTLSPRLFPDTARAMPLQHLGSPFARLGPPRTVENGDAVDTIDVIVGGWQGLIEAHHLPARRDVVFALAAEGGVPTSRPASLTLRCRKGTLDASLETQQSVARVAARAVTVRFGPQTPQPQTWARGRDHTTLMVPGDQAHVRAFLDELGSHGRLTIEVARSPTLPPSAFTFNLEGIPVVVAELESACVVGSVQNR